MTVKLTLQNATQNKNIPSKAQFKKWLSALFKKNDTIEITIRIVGKKESEKLNYYFRKKQKPTNVLAFPYSTLSPLLGDLVICAPIVTTEAKEQKKELMAHFAHLTIHGTLHLLGYDHIKIKDAKKMERLETRIMQQLNFNDPYCSNNFLDQQF